MQQLRANLWLLGLTILICAVGYPLALWVVGQVAFPFQAQGSLVNQLGKPVDNEQDAIGSRLIAQPFSGAEYFQPRPSAVSYNGAASGASNWGASNPALRKRVVGMLGVMLQYRDGRPVGPDIVAWTRENLQKTPSILGDWSKTDGNLAERWVNADKANADFVAAWGKEHAEVVARWRQDHSAAEVKPAAVAELYFASYAAGASKSWPKTDGKDLQSAFFEVWWTAHPDAHFKPVPADAVMASGSGLDPHITLDNALYQLDRITEKWATAKNRDRATVRKTIETMLRDNASAPLLGMSGGPLVNVLEINIALQEQFGT